MNRPYEAGRKPSTLLSAGLLLLAVLAGGCSDGPKENPEVPRGYLPVLQVEQGTRLHGFGPFVGYYFKPASPGDFSEVDFVCFNEDSFYSSDAPEGALLYTGRGMLKALPKTGDPVAEKVFLSIDGRMKPFHFGSGPSGPLDKAPRAWAESRPAPKEEFRHFHSLHDASGPVRMGYWLRHVAQRDFIYDMGGRMDENSPLYHHVLQGVDREFATIIELDAGPGRSQKPNKTRE